MTVFLYGNHHFLVNKKPTAQAYRALLNVLALPLSPLGSEGGAPGILRWRPYRDWKTITENGPYSTTIIGFLGTTQLGICKGPLGTGDSPWLDGQWGRLLLSWGSYCPSQCRNACEWTGLYSWSNQVPVPSNSPEVLWLCNGLSGTWTRTGGFSLSVRLPIGKKMWLSKTSIHYVGYRKFNRTPPHISLETMHFRRSSPSILWIIGPSPAGEVCWKSRSPKFLAAFAAIGTRWNIEYRGLTILSCFFLRTLGSQKWCIQFFWTTGTRWLAEPPKRLSEMLATNGS